MLATLPAVDNVRTRLPTTKNYIPKGFSVRVYKGATAGQSSATATFNVGYRGYSAEQTAPTQNWYPSRTTADPRTLGQSAQNSSIPSSHDLDAQLRQPRSRFSIYQNGNDNTYVYEPSLSTNNDIYSNSDFDSSATSLTATSATESTDSLVAIKSPPTTHASLAHDPRSSTAPILRSQKSSDVVGRPSSDRSLQSYPTSSANTGNHHLYIRTDQGTLTVPPSSLRPSPITDDLDSPLYPPSTVSEFERREREVLAKNNAELNASSSSSSNSSYSGTPMLAIPVPPSQRGAPTTPSSAHQFFPSIPLRSSPEQDPTTIPRQNTSDFRSGGSLPAPSSYRPASETMRRNSADNAPSAFRSHRSSMVFQPQGSNEGSPSAAASRYVPASQTMVAPPSNAIYAPNGPGPSPNAGSYEAAVAAAQGAYPPMRTIHSDPHGQVTPVYGLNRTPSRSPPRQEIAAPIPSSHRPPTHVSAGTPPRTSPQGSPHNLNRTPSQRGSPPVDPRRSPPNHASGQRSSPQIYRPADAPVSLPGPLPVPQQQQSSFATPNASGTRGGISSTNVIQVPASPTPTPLSHITSDLRHPAPPGHPTPQRRLSDSESYVPHSSTTVPGPQTVVSVETPSSRPDPQRRYSDTDQGMVSSANRGNMALMHAHAHLHGGRSVRWNENLICPSPLLACNRRKGWFNRRGDQLWTNGGSYKPAPEGAEYPPDLNEYPERGDGWMNEEGVRIDMLHRLVPKVPKKSALKR